MNTSEGPGGNCLGEFAVLAEIAGASDPSTPIPLELVLGAIRDDRIEVNGLAFEIVNSPDALRRISPSICDEDVQRLLLTYLPQCVIHSRQDEWVVSPYIAAYAIADSIKQLWAKGQAGQELLARWNEVLKNIVLVGEDRVRECIILGVFEHILGCAGLQQYFSDWRNQPILRSVYEEALFIIQGSNEGDSTMSIGHV